MKNRRSILFSLFLVLLLTGAGQLFAGTVKVRFGAYAAGKECSGTGICSIGTASGASVTFDNTMNATVTGGVDITLTMTFSYDDAVANGFTGDAAKGGTYTFTDGYKFNHPEDQATGVPANYMIPVDCKATYQPKDAKGNITFTIKLVKQY